MSNEEPTTEARTSAPDRHSMRSAEAETDPTDATDTTDPGDPTDEDMLVETSVDAGEEASDRAAEPNRTIVEARSIDVWYDDDRALRDVSMEVPEEKVTAMIGPSGCGKSTFLRCINRMNDLVDAARVEGELLLGSKNVYDTDVDPIALRRRVGIVFQKPNPFPESIYDNVAYGLEIQDVEGDHDAIVERSLKRAALWEEVEGRLDESGLELSGGPTTTPLYRPGDRNRPRGTAHGRTRKRARSDRDLEDRGPHRRPRGGVYGRDRHPQHATGRPDLR